MLTEAEIAQAAQDSTKGYTRVPLPVQAVMRALDRRFGAAAGVLFLGELRQVRRYLGDPALKAAAGARVAAAVAGGVGCWWGIRWGRWWRWSSSVSTQGTGWTCC